MNDIRNTAPKFERYTRQAPGSFWKQPEAGSTEPRDSVTSGNPNHHTCTTSDTARAENANKNYCTTADTAAAGNPNHHTCTTADTAAAGNPNHHTCTTSDTAQAFGGWNIGL